MGWWCNRSLAASAALSIVAAACGGTGGSAPLEVDAAVPGDDASVTVPEIANIVLSPAVSTLEAIDATVGLTATATDASGAPVTGVTFAWSSSEPTVAAVAADSGLVTALSPGSVTVTATASGRAGVATVHVAPTVARIEVTPASWSVAFIGARQQLVATALDANGHPVTGVAVVWASADPGIVSVDTDGVMTARANGSTTVSATYGATSGTVPASVAAPDELAGVVFTAWFARSDKAPALLVDRRIELPSGIHPDFPLQAIRPWPHDDVDAFQWEGDRIALWTDVVNGVGNLRVRDRADEWTLLALADAAGFQLERNRIALVTAAGGLRVKDGVHGPWTELATRGVTQFQLAGDRIGVVSDDGSFRVKDGVHGAWTVLATSGVAHFQLEADRIGVLQSDGAFRVKDGVSGAWTVLAASGTVAFRLEGNRIAMLNDAGVLSAKDGISGGWHALASGGVRQLELEGDRIGVLGTDGVFRVKNGLDGAWTVLASSGVREIQLQGDLIGMLGDDGTLSIKTGTSGPWRTSAAFAGMPITQMRLLVYSPTPPFRTRLSAPYATYASYADSRAECAARAGGVDCYPSWAFGLVPIYGRFCGAGLPSDWDLAVAAGTVDSLDELCKHHDLAGTWYADESAGAFDACIVNYGLVHSRLTRDGALLTRGSDAAAAWNAGWGSMMPELKAALDAYFAYTSGCPLADLETSTAAPYF